MTTVPVLVQVDANHSIQEYLEEIQFRATEMMPYEHTGIQNIQKLSSEAYAACQYQNLLVVQAQSSTTSSSTERPDDGQDSSANFADFNPYALTLICETDTDSATGRTALSTSASFDSQVTDEQQMIRILRQFSHIIKQLSLKTKATLGEIEMISPEDINELQRWNGEDLQWADEFVHNYLGRHAQINNPAVVAWDGSLSYDELDKASTCLAKYLRSLGVGTRPDDRVPLCFEKSMWIIVAMVGVINARAAFVPIDSNQPISRLKTLVQKTSAQVVLTSALCANMFSGTVGITTVVLDQCAIDNIDGNSLPECPIVPGESALYVLFDAMDITVISIPQGEETQVCLIYCEDVIPNELAQDLLVWLCASIQALAQGLDGQLPTLPLRVSWSELPLQIENSESQKLSFAVKAHNQTETVISPIVKEAWEFVFGMETVSAQIRNKGSDVPFYDIWGSLIAAAQFSEFYAKHGVHFTMEEMIENPTMLSQDLMIRQQ